MDNIRANVETALQTVGKVIETRLVTSDNLTLSDAVRVGQKLIMAQNAMAKAAEILYSANNR